jgi:hypothetical protein
VTRNRERANQFDASRHETLELSNSPQGFPSYFFRVLDRAVRAAYNFSPPAARELGRSSRPLSACGERPGDLLPRPF